MTDSGDWTPRSHLSDEGPWERQYSSEPAPFSPTDDGRDADTTMDHHAGVDEVGGLASRKVLADAKGGGAAAHDGDGGHGAFAGGSETGATRKGGPVALPHADRGAPPISNGSSACLGAWIPQHQHPESLPAYGVAQPVFAGGQQFLPCPAGSRQVPAMWMVPFMGMPPPFAQSGQQRPRVHPATAPGSWFPAEPPGRLNRVVAGGADDRTSVESAREGRSIRLLGPTRPSAPLRHNRRHAVTSLTINGIPFQMRKPQLCALLDETGFAERYNYLYMPCNHSDKTNRGHAFVNLCSPQDAKDFFSAWHGGRIVGEGMSGTLLSISVSVEQGLEASVKHWTVARMLNMRDPDFRPFIAGIGF